jgi:hypothetical protein
MAKKLGRPQSFIAKGGERRIDARFIRTEASNRYGHQ